MIKNLNITHSLQITQVPISALNPAPYNPRTWDQQAIQQLTKSLQQFGLVDPIIVNGAEQRKNIIIGGHFCLKIAQKLGYIAVPVVYLNIPDLRTQPQTQPQYRNLGLRTPPKI